LILGLALSACDNGGGGGSDTPVQDRSSTVKVFGGTSSVTVKVMGPTLQAEWNNIAGKIAGRVNTITDPYEQDMVKDMLGARDVIYIVEPSPAGYTNWKTIGDGKTIYIALAAVDTAYVNNCLAGIYGNGSAVGKAIDASRDGLKRLGRA